MDLLFNVIFVPGTVRYLRLAALSLMEMSNYRFRLVANGLNEAEQTQLREFCEAMPRLEYCRSPQQSLIPHGTMLNLLYDRDDDEHFCFMDSDIFACEPFNEELEKHLVDCDVFSSCLAAGHDHKVSGQGYGGNSIQTPTGLPLATTFFAIYRREPLVRIIRETGIGFEIVHPNEGLPPIPLPIEHIAPLRSQLLLDTGKLMNMCAASAGLRFRFRPLDGLLHVGGISSYAVRDPVLRRIARGARRIVGRPFRLDEAYLTRLSKRRKSRMSRSSGRPTGLVPQGMAMDEATYLRQRSLRRAIAFYFMEYMRALIDGGTLPRLDLDNDDLAKRITKACRVARRMHDSYHHVW